MTLAAALPEPSVLLSPAEVARILGVSRPKVYTLMAAAQLRSVKMGGSRRIFRDSVDAYVAELREQAGR
jgi:excisionase family DNA binding protein